MVIERLISDHALFPIPYQVITLASLQHKFFRFQRVQNIQREHNQIFVLVPRFDRYYAGITFPVSRCVPFPHHKSRFSNSDRDKCKCLMSHHQVVIVQDVVRQVRRGLHEFGEVVGIESLIGKFPDVTDVQLDAFTLAHFEQEFVGPAVQVYVNLGKPRVAIGMNGCE